MTAPARRPTPGLPWRVACGAVAVALGATLALFGASRVETGPRLGHFVFSLGCVVTIVGLPLCVRWMTVAMASRTGGTLLLLAWVGTVLRLGSPNAYGSLGLAGDAPGLVLLLGGCLTGGMTAGVARVDPPRGRIGRKVARLVGSRPV